MRLRQVDYEGMCDEDLVARFQSEGCQRSYAVLVKRYQPLIASIARNYFVPGASSDDVHQEAQTGFFEAVRDFDPSQEVAFRSFASSCANRNVHDAIRKARTHRASVLTYAARFSPVPDEADSSVIDEISNPISTERQVEARAEWNSMAEKVGIAMSAEDIETLAGQVGRVPLPTLAKQALRRSRPAAVPLSDAEASVLVGKLAGMSYDEMASEIGRSVKGVDNASQKLKQKLRRARPAGGTESAAV